MVLVCNSYADKPSDDFFERSVRPVLSSHCFKCHSSIAQKGGLRLDSRKAILEGGTQGVIVIPGNPASSKLMNAINHSGDLKMPRSKKIPDSDINAIEKWISMGLPWPEEQNNLIKLKNNNSNNHWSFLPINKSLLSSDVKLHPVDFFIQKELDKNKITASPKADKKTILRRMKFNLHGTPPTLEELLLFENDNSVDAIEKLIDRLLGSPRYGERWGRHWLDIARYADNKGYVFFEDKNYPWAWTYRDYVIESFNKDLPYKQFLLEQIAADHLNLKDKKSLAALGFLTVGGHFMGNTHDVIDDRIDVLTRGLMGLTVSCARCHDHKFDPIPTADYYSLYGVLRSSREPLVPPLYESEPQTDEYKKFAGELKDKENKLADFVSIKHKELVNQARIRAGDYLYAAFLTRNLPPSDDFMLLADKGDLNPSMITRWRTYLNRMAIKNDSTWSLWHRYAALSETDFSTQASKVTSLPTDNPLVAKEFVKVPLSMKQVSEVYEKLLKENEKTWITSKSFKLMPDANAEKLRLVFYGSDSPADAPINLDWGFLDLFPDRSTQAEYQKLIKEVETQANKGPARSMVLLDTEIPYESSVFIRGHPNRLGDKTPRKFLSLLEPQPSLFTKGSGRLELALAITSEHNPLTARVMVNQVWSHYFGRGIVSTPGDFGMRGDPPSHPRLLDWLSDYFIQNDWSIKKLHKLILTSSTYQQSSNDREECLQKDSENRLLWKQNRGRLDFESLHDSILSVSGNLDLKIGGPSVSLFTGKNRRAVYGFIDRLEFPSLLATFDLPNPASASVERTNTTVATQALYLMNGPFARDAARKILKSPAIKDKINPEDKINAIISLVLSRKPSKSEMAKTLEFVKNANPDEAWLDLVHGLLLTNEFTFYD